MLVQVVESFCDLHVFFNVQQILNEVNPFHVDACMKSAKRMSSKKYKSHPLNSNIAKKC